MCNSTSISTRAASESSRDVVVWPGILGSLLLMTVLADATVRRANPHLEMRAVASREAPTGEALHSLSLRPSHNGLFRAAVVDAQEGSAAGPGSEWTVRVTDAVGAPITDARLDVEVWRPETGERSRLQPRSGLHQGNGEYPITMLDFPQPGWWNVALQIAAGAGTDSLAFNLVLPESERSRGARR